MKNYDNKGIAYGTALLTTDEMVFEFGKTDFWAVDRFEVKLREYSKNKNISLRPGGGTETENTD